MSRDDAERFVPLTHLMYFVLLALAGEPAHAYALVRRIRDLSAGRVDPGTGSFYVILRQAVDSGLVREASGDAGGRRRTYDITALGRSVLDAEAKRLETQLRDTRRVLRTSPRRLR